MSEQLINNDDLVADNTSIASAIGVDAGASGPAQFAESEGGRTGRGSNALRPQDIDYKNVGQVSKFLDRRGRILSRRKTRASAKVQRKIAQAVKRARHLSLIPYTADQTRVVRKRR